jgi:hypothetical protein
MEGLILRGYALGAALVAIGGYFVVSNNVVRTPKTETWLEQKAPTTVAGTLFDQSLQNPNQTYKMDKVVYDTLHPFGIVCRVYNVAGEPFDTVLIASASKDSFHDPRDCFSAQGYEISGEETVAINTASRGVIHATYAQLKGPNGNSDAVFFYKGPEGFIPTTLDLKVSIFKHELATGTNTDGVFYRFITPSEPDAKDKLIKFVSQYVDAANQSSGGYF